MAMSDAVVVYSTQEHLNSIKDFAILIGKRHPSISVVLIGTAAAAPDLSAAPSVTYHRLPMPEIPPGSNFNHLELFFEIPRLNNPNLRLALTQISEKLRIRAIAMDLFCNWAFEVSSSLGIPTYFIQTSGASGLAVGLYWPTLHDTVAVDMAELDGVLSFPGCPLIHSSDLPKMVVFPKSNLYSHFLEMARSLRKSAGIVVFSFQALEFRAIEAMRNGLCVPEAPSPPIYPILPMLLGGGGSGESHECLKWLDRQPSKSVIFLCFGRRGVFPGIQLRELAIGLENSGHRFLWVVRNPPELGSMAGDEPDLDSLLPEGFLQRTKNRGLILKSWAPQAAVLGHNSVGGFVSHCGHNSILEAVSNGVPIIGLPLYAEQRMNRVFLVEELKLALPLDEEANGLITAAELEKRVRELMESKAGVELQRRVEEMKNSAAAAMKPGGSCAVALEKFLASITGN